MLSEKREPDILDELVSIHHAAWLVTLEKDCPDEAHAVFSGLDNMIDKYKNVIERIENLPCCMSCYVTQDELRSAQNMKKCIIEILKGEK